MGIVLVPVFIGALLIFIKAIFNLIPLIKSGDISIPGVLLGVLIPIIIIAFVMLGWIKEGKVYAFTPHFRFVFMLFYLPLFLSTTKNYIVKFADTMLVQTTLVTWVIFSGLIIIPLLSRCSGFLKGKGVHFFY